MNEEILNDWEEFAEMSASLTNTSSAFHPAFVFRGQSNATLPLRPSLLRILLDGKADLSLGLEIEKEAFTAFKKQACIHLDNVDRHSTNALDWWIMMQHYGVPTRLLDWTRSPFVALYFAVERDFDQSGAIWAVELNPFMRAMKVRDPTYKLGCKLTIPTVFMEIDHQTPDTLHFVDADEHTDRMAAQQTAFSVSSLPVRRSS